MIARCAAAPILAGMKVLVAEDVWLSAVEMESTLVEVGATVIGPAASLPDAKRLIATETIHCAVLDIDLGGRACYPVAAELERRGIAIIFVTGHEKPHLPPSLRSYPLLHKPFPPARLQEAVAAVAPRS